MQHTRSYTPCVHMYADMHNNTHKHPLTSTCIHMHTPHSSYAVVHAQACSVHTHQRGYTSTHVYALTCIVNLAASTTLHPHLGDLEQELILTTKTPKATVGGLNPSKSYTLQIFELTDSGPILLARREFVSKSSCTQMGGFGWKASGLCPEALCL